MTRSGRPRRAPGRALPRIGHRRHLVRWTPHLEGSTNSSGKRCSRERGSTSAASRSCRASVSYVTKEIEAARASVILVKGRDDRIRAFYNVCRHRGNKLVWNDFPGEATRGTCRQFTCKYPRVALRSRRHAEVCAAAIGVFRPRHSRIRITSGALRSCERLHLHQFRS